MRNTDHAASVGLLATGAERSGLRNRSRNRHNVSLAVTIAACLLLPTIASAASPHGKRQLGRAWHGYGFLPGYRPPEQIELDQARSRAMEARAFTGGAGTAVASDPAGRRRQSGRTGIAGKTEK
jgi:hypothetical protein